MLDLFFCENSWNLTHECHEMTGRIIKPVGKRGKPFLYISEVMFFHRNSSLTIAIVDNFDMNLSKTWRAYKFEIWLSVDKQDTWSTL